MSELSGGSVSELGADVSPEDGVVSDDVGVSDVSSDDGVSDDGDVGSVVSAEEETELLAVGSEDVGADGVGNVALPVLPEAVVEAVGPVEEPIGCVTDPVGVVVPLPEVVATVLPGPAGTVGSSGSVPVGIVPVGYV